MYLEQCRELLATLHNVLFGTAGDWWAVVRLETSIWREFELLSVFVSEDYIDELE